MSYPLYTNEQLAELETTAKKVTIPDVGWKHKPKKDPGHTERELQAEAGDHKFTIRQRQSLGDPQNYTCGIWYWTETGAQMVLARYNGPSHRHGSIRFKPHIHKVTEEVLAAGKRPDSEATETDRYTTLEGATDCLIEDFNVTGFSHRMQQAELL